jgi:antitoxin component YwqK of YwqJK toxin-antitoxin module
MRYLLIAALIFSLGAQAQWKTYIIGVKHDTLNRVDLKGLKQGPWVVHVDPLRGEEGYDEQGYFKDDQKEGTWKRFSNDGDLIAVENYHLGMKDGKSKYFLNTGELLREESWRAIDPKHPYDTIDVTDVNDPSKVLRKEIVKVEPNSYKNGTWTYYNNDGTIQSTEDWVMNKRKEDIVATNNDDLAPIDVTKGGSKANSNTAQTEEKKPVAKPKEVLEFEKKNAGKKKIKVRDGSTGG